MNNDIRCGHCGRKLAEGEYISITIKCPRCGCLNHLKAASLHYERHGTPSQGIPDGHESHRSVAGRKATPG
ncbi:Com family DNA-binding transcriptional regulator [Microvirgula aerodenitrificans]|uniref:Com family DNA-binding transcriptional regulator n=1 Tax=Microvirgula aerodenitrificans TaxID=57480 RepID=UPI0028E9FE84|nr:Com family DNA-binding transcriptional regulator [Microvirgula aerodenitrificans]